MEKAPIPAPQNQHSNYIMHPVALHTQYKECHPVVLLTVQHSINICPNITKYYFLYITTYFNSFAGSQLLCKT